MPCFDPNTSLLEGMSTAALQAALTSAQNGLIALNMGQRATTVTVTGGGTHREVTFQKSEQAGLVNLIRLLQAQLGIIPVPRRGSYVRFH